MRRPREPRVGGPPQTASMVVWGSLAAGEVGGEGLV